MLEGRITSYDPSSRTGQINDADDNEYRFTMADWQERTKPAPGTNVVFEPMSGKAYKISIIGQPQNPAESGSPIAAWISLVVGVFFFVTSIGLAAQIDQPHTVPEALKAANDTISLLVFMTANLMLATYAMAKGPRGRIVARISVGLNAFAWLAAAGSAIHMIEQAAGAPL